MGRIEQHDKESQMKTALQKIGAETTRMGLKTLVTFKYQDEVLDETTSVTHEEKSVNLKEFGFKVDHDSGTRHVIISPL